LPPPPSAPVELLDVVVPAGSPYKTMADLVAAFKADPGKVS